MVFFRHPKPVVDPRPIAELSLQAETAAPLNAVSLTASYPPADEREAPIRFTVRYRLFEYLCIVGDFIPIALREAGKPHAGLGPGWRLLLVLIASPVFLYKKLRVGDCRFHIDSQGLVRHSRTGRTALPWRDVHMVHALSRGYLVRKRSGAMPLPYRCFTAGQREQFDRWAARPA